MNASLIIPLLAGRPRRFKLVAEGSAEPRAAGLRVARSHICRVLDGRIFQDLRDMVGARIETDDPEGVARALRLAKDEPGICPANHSFGSPPVRPMADNAMTAMKTGSPSKGPRLVTRSVATPITRPAHDEIARRAYLLWEQMGCPHQKDIGIWLQAESQLRNNGGGPVAAA